MCRLDLAASLRGLRFWPSWPALLAAFLLLAPGAVAQTPAIDAERTARMADALDADATRALAGLYRGARLLELHAEHADAREVFLADVQKRGRSVLARDHARFLLAQRMAGAADLDGARASFRALGIVDRAQMIGPFANTGGTAFGTASPIDDVGAALDAAIPGLERVVRFHDITLDPRGVFDVGAQMTVTRETRAFVAFAVDARAATPAAIRVGSSGQVRVLVNGVEVGRDDAQRDHALDQSVFGALLAAGPNLVVLELGFIEAAAHATVRLTRPDGAALAGVKVAATRAALAGAAKKKRALQGGAPVVAGLVNPLATPDARERLRMFVDIETYLGAADERKKPATLRTAFESLVAAPGLTPLERSSLLARLGVERRADDLTAARELYEQALALDPRNTMALLELADVRDDQGRPHDTRALLRRAMEAAPTSDIAVQRLLDFNRRTADSGIVADNAVVARAQAAPTRRNLSAAADILEDRGDRVGALALVRQMRDAAWVARLDEAYARARLAEEPAALDELLNALGRQLALRPASHELAERVALALQSAGRTTEATALIEERARLYPERAEPDAARAALALARGDRALARVALLAALEKKPQDAELARTRRALESEDELVTRYGIALDDVRALPSVPEAVRPGAEVLANTTAIRLFDNGLARIINDRVLRVVDVEKARGLQRMAFDFSDGRETLDVLVAEKWSAAGRREPARRIYDNRNSGKVGGVYSDGAARVVEFGPLENGDVIFVRTRKELVGRQNLFGDFFGVLEPLQGVLPVRNWRLVIEAPAKQQLFWGGRNAPEPTVTPLGALRVHDFVRPVVMPIVPEPGMPPFLELAEFLSVTTYASWSDMGRWYEALAAPALVLDDELRRIAAREKGAARDEADLVRRLYEYVVTSTRYVGIELGIHGWKPYPVAEVHRRRYGDCKDKASLLVSLLREAGVPANLALVRTANLGALDNAPASMWNFNHAIAYVPSLDLFLDGTAEQSGWRELPTMDQGAQSLIVGVHGPHKESRLVTIPTQAADANLNISDYVLRLDPSGSLDVRGQERFRGHSNAQQRRDFADPATQRDVLQRHLAGVMPGTVVHRVNVTDLSLARDELGYDFTATLPARAVRDSADALTMPVSLYPHDLAGSYADRSTRKTDIFVDHPWRTRNVMRYVLPPGFEVRDLPAGGRVESPHLRFTQRIERTADGFIVDEDAWILTRRIPVADYPAFRRDTLAADALMKRKVRIVKVTGAQPTPAAARQGEDR